MGLKGHIVEVLIRYFGLTAVLEFERQEMEGLERWNHCPGRWPSLGGDMYSPLPPPVGSGEFLLQKPFPWINHCLGAPTAPFKEGRLEAAVSSKLQERESRDK